jgi:hypothetical protein
LAGQREVAQALLKKTVFAHIDENSIVILLTSFSDPDPQKNDSWI